MGIPQERAVISAAVLRHRAWEMMLQVQFFLVAILGHTHASCAQCSVNFLQFYRIVSQMKFEKNSTANQTLCCLNLKMSNVAFSYTTSWEHSEDFWSSFSALPVSFWSAAQESLVSHPPLCFLVVPLLVLPVLWFENYFPSESWVSIQIFLLMLLLLLNDWALSCSMIESNCFMYFSKFLTYILGCVDYFHHG